MQSFHQKYQPKTIADFYMSVELKSIFTDLAALDAAPPVLVVGEPNTGKSTLLHAIVRDYYGEDAPQLVNDLNVLFVNNLDEQQGINFFRNEMLSFCQIRSRLPPGKKKVVVVDDLDSIHQQCQQVLCNYIDGHSAHIRFIFSCTNQQKIIDNVQSRAVILTMEPPTHDYMSHLHERILREEGIEDWFDAGDRAAIHEYLLFISSNNYRELVNLMEKVIVFHGDDPACQITMRTCRDLFLTRIYQSFQTYLGHLKQGALNEAVGVMRDVVANGYSVVDIFDYLFKFIKMEGAAGGAGALTENEKYEVVKLLMRYITLIRSFHEDNIELLLFTNNLHRLLWGARENRGLIQ
jgi:replication factor C subunit 2/4